MLVRRFTIVCLLATVFGMAFASLVIEMGEERRWQDAAVLSCVAGHACAIPQRH